MKGVSASAAWIGVWLGVASERGCCLECGFLGRQDKTPNELLDWPESAGQRLQRLTALKQLGMLELRECASQQRQQLGRGDYGIRVSSGFALLCTRLMWDEWEFGETEADIKGRLQQELRVDRACRLFRRHEPGYSPVEHKEILQEAKTRKVLVTGTLLGAMIGAAAAIIAGALGN